MVAIALCTSNLILVALQDLVTSVKAKTSNEGFKLQQDSRQVSRLQYETHYG